MFPLGTVLLPSAGLPLHVFEPRYRALVRDCLAGRPGVRRRAHRAGQRGRRRRRAHRRRDGGPHRRGRGAPRRPVGARRRRGAAPPGRRVAARRPVPDRRGRGLARSGARRRLRRRAGATAPRCCAGRSAWPPRRATRRARPPSSWPTTRCWRATRRSPSRRSDRSTGTGCSRPRRPTPASSSSLTCCATRSRCSSCGWGALATGSTLRSPWLPDPTTRRASRRSRPSCGSSPSPTPSRRRSTRSRASAGSSATAWAARWCSASARVLLLLSLLRALQTETGTTFTGSLSWIPYLIVVARGGVARRPRGLAGREAKGTRPVNAQPETVHRPIQRRDLEAKIRELQGDVEETGAVGHQHAGHGRRGRWRSAWSPSRSSRSSQGPEAHHRRRGPPDLMLYWLELAPAVRPAPAARRRRRDLDGRRVRDVPHAPLQAAPAARPRSREVLRPGESILITHTTQPHG